MNNIKTAIFGCGCFVSKEILFKQLRGVVKTRIGFTGGSTYKPNYLSVSEGVTGHAQAVEITYDANIIRFPLLLKAFFSFHDATVQRKNKKDPYRSVVFVSKPKEQIIAKRAIDLLVNSGLNVKTNIENKQLFWEYNIQNGEVKLGHGFNITKTPRKDLEQIDFLEAAKSYKSVA